MRARERVGLLVAVLAAACALAAAPAVANGPSARAQAREVYAPVATFYRSITKTQRKLMKGAAKQTGHHLDACQRPYLKRLMGGRVGSTKGKIDTIYGHVTLLQTYESVESYAVPQLTVAMDSWAKMKLANGKLDGLAHAQADELAASLFLPRVDACAFITELAQNKFSLTWAKHSAWAKLSKTWLTKVERVSSPSARGSNYIYHQHLLSRNQQIALVNFPGMVS
jgi:hypothetical protein